MTDAEFMTLSGKLDKVHTTCLETQGIVSGHTNRIEGCEQDRDELFSSRNDHQTRLTKIETSRKERSINKGEDRREKTSRFDWTLRVVITLFIGLNTTMMVIKYFKG